MHLLSWPALESKYHGHFDFLIINLGKPEGTSSKRSSICTERQTERRATEKWNIGCRRQSSRRDAQTGSTSRFWKTETVSAPYIMHLMIFLGTMLQSERYHYVLNQKLYTCDLFIWTTPTNENICLKQQVIPHLWQLEIAWEFLILVTSFLGFRRSGHKQPIPCLWHGRLS